MNKINKQRKSINSTSTEISLINQKIVILQTNLNKLIRDRNIIVRTIKQHEQVAMQYESIIINHQNIESEKLSQLLSQCNDLKKSLEKCNEEINDLKIQINSQNSKLLHSNSNSKSNEKEMKRTPLKRFSLNNTNCGRRRSVSRRRSSVKKEIDFEEELDEMKQYVYSDLTKCVLRIYKRVKSLEKK